MVWASHCCSAILCSAMVEITLQAQGQVSSSPLGKFQSGHSKYTTHRSPEDTWFTWVFLELAILSMGSKCRSYSLRITSPFQSILNGQLAFPSWEWEMGEWFPWTWSSFSSQDLMSPECFEIFHISASSPWEKPWKSSVIIYWNLPSSSF